MSRTNPKSSTKNVATDSGQNRLSQGLAQGLYNILVAIVYLLAALNLILTGFNRSEGYRKRKQQRLGFLPDNGLHNNGGILLHCVSVGEVVAASALVKRIRKSQPDFPVTITTTTATGHERVMQIFGDTVGHYYLPYDTQFAMKTLLKRVKPEKVLITEVELWPNMIDTCWRAQIPVYILNARLTDKSARSYRKLAALFMPMLNKITAICAQGERDFKNYQTMGTAEDKLYLTNNIKFDQPLSDEDIRKAKATEQQLNIGNRPVLLGASTHDPEEETLITSYKELKTTHPNLLLVITPRHPERFKKVEKLISESGLRLLRFSENKQVTDDINVLLVDAMGVLKSMYAIASYAFVGGSIADRGGHNALEAALFAKPILMGPNTYNNPVICQTLIDAGALKIVPDANAITRHVAAWLSKPDDAKNSGDAGIRVLEENAGAIGKSLKVMGIDV